MGYIRANESVRLARRSLACSRMILAFDRSDKMAGLPCKGEQDMVIFTACLKRKKS